MLGLRKLVVGVKGASGRRCRWSRPVPMLYVLYRPALAGPDRNPIEAQLLLELLSKVS